MAFTGIDVSDSSGTVCCGRWTHRAYITDAQYVMHAGVSSSQKMTDDTDSRNMEVMDEGKTKARRAGTGEAGESTGAGSSPRPLSCRDVLCSISDGQR